MALYDRPTDTGRLSVNPSVNRDGGIPLGCGIWLRAMRTQRTFAHGWHVLPVYRNVSGHNVIYAVTPLGEPKRPEPVNLVTLALAFRKMLDDGTVSSQSHLAQQVGLARARVTQILNLLKLPDSVIRNLCSIPESKGIAFFSERRLHSITRLPSAKELIRTFHDLMERAAGIAAL